MCGEAPSIGGQSLFVSVNQLEQDIIFSRSTLHAQPGLVFSLITAAVIVPVTPDTEGCTALPLALLLTVCLASECPLSRAPVGSSAAGHGPGTTPAAAVVVLPPHA